MRVKYKFLALTISLLVSSQAWAQLDIKVETYVQKYKDAALEDEYAYGIPASITLAQGINESAIGQSYLAREGNNHFGIKCGRKWTGPSLNKDDDTKDECFRKYSSAKESFDDHSKFLTENPRYAFLFEIAPDDYRSWAYGLKKAGYATSPTYAEDLIEAIEKYNLNRWDKADKGTTIKEMLTTETEPSTSTQKPYNNNPGYKTMPWDSSFMYKGLNAFYAYEGKSLTPISRFYKISLKRMLKYNDLDTDLLPESTVLFLEPKYSIGKDSFLTVPPGQSTVWKLSQMAAINLKDMMFLNNIDAEDIPEAGQRLSLIAPNPNKVKLNGNPYVSKPTPLDLSGNKTKPSDPQKVERTVIIHETQETGEVVEYGNEDPTKYKITREEIIEIPDRKITQTKGLKDNDNIDFDDLVHVVGKGENLNMISLLYRVDKQDIIDRNGLQSETLEEGQQLIIPPVSAKEEPKTIGQVIEEGTQPITETIVEVIDVQRPLPPTPPAAKPSTGYYTVKNGDNLYRIAKKYGVSPEDIVRANNKDNQMVFVGEKLKIPSGSTASTDDTPATGEVDHGYKVGLHTVEQGENLYRVSLKYNMTIDAIKKLNNLDGDTIEVGQKLKVYK